MTSTRANPKISMRITSGSMIIRPNSCFCAARREPQDLPERRRARAEDHAAQKQLFGRMIIEPEVIRMLIFGFALVLVMTLRPAACGRPRCASANSRSAKP